MKAQHREHRSPRPEQLIAVGRAAGCFGVHGHLNIVPLTHRIERFDDLGVVFRGRTAESAVADKVTDVRIRKSKVHLRFASAPDRTSAEKIVGQYLFVPEDRADPPPEGTWFVHDIVGCAVVTEDARDAGTVTDVIHLAGYDLWVVRNAHGESLLPAINEFVVDVDTARRRIVIQLIDGLIEGM